MNKQQLARKRNFLKLRIMGFNITSYEEVLTDHEKITVRNIKEKLDILLKEWNTNNVDLGLKKRPRCKYCWKRRKVQDGICRQCEQAIIESDGDVLSDEQKQLIHYE